LGGNMAETMVVHGAKGMSMVSVQTGVSVNVSMSRSRVDQMATVWAVSLGLCTL
jgi:hypothetical protein